MYHVSGATVAGSSNHFTASSVLVERRGNRVTSHDAVFTFLSHSLIAEIILQAEQLLTQDLLSHLQLQVLGLGFILVVLISLIFIQLLNWARHSSRTFPN